MNWRWPWVKLVRKIPPVNLRHELRACLQDINLSAATLNEFMSFLTTSPHSHAVSFSEFRDFLLLLPRRATTAEIYRYYQVRKYMGDDGRGGVARVTMEGDVSISGEDRPQINGVKPSPIPIPVDHVSAHEDDEYDDDFDEEELEETNHHSTSLKFLIAGGIAGAGKLPFYFQRPCL